MKKKNFQKTLFIIGILAFISGYSNDNDYDECEDYKSTFQGHSAPKDQMQKKYNHPARVDVRGSWDYYVSGSYIYWHPSEEGLELARERNVPDPVNNPEDVNNRLVHMDFDYHSGFKVGTGGNFEYDDWSLDFEYTRLYTTDHRSKTLPADTFDDLRYHSFLIFWENAGGGPGLSLCFHAKGRWKLHFNILDVILARSYYVGTKLSFKPFFGLRGGWIGQRYNALYIFKSFSPVEALFNYNTHGKSSSWLLGARMGVDTNWHLGEGFRLFGNTAASLFYQRFKTNLNFVSEIGVADLERSTIKEREGYFNPNFEIALGLGWGSYFDSDKWHIDLSTAYEFHIFWHQNMMRKMVDYQNYREDPTPGDLVLHGLTVSLQLDF
jgi:hypothetical protein